MAFYRFPTTIYMEVTFFLKCNFWYKEMTLSQSTQFINTSVWKQLYKWVFRLFGCRKAGKYLSRVNNIKLVQSKKSHLKHNYLKFRFVSFSEGLRHGIFPCLTWMHWNPLYAQSTQASYTPLGLKATEINCLMGCWKTISWAVSFLNSGSGNSMLTRSISQKHIPWATFAAWLVLTKWQKGWCSWEPLDFNQVSIVSRETSAQSWHL